MYFAYGWPKVAFTELQPGDAYVYLHATDKYFFAVSHTSVQLWTGGQHRLKLSESARGEADVKQEGWNCAALWCAAKSTLAILTSENYLHLYAIHTWKDTLLPSCNFAAKDIQKVDIYLRSSIRMDSESRAYSLTGDSRTILVGFGDGTVASLSWLGKMREVAYPLDDAAEYDAPWLGDNEDGQSVQASRRKAGVPPSASQSTFLPTPHVGSTPATPPPEPVSMRQHIPAPHGHGGDQSTTAAAAAASTAAQAAEALSAATSRDGVGTTGSPSVFATSPPVTASNGFAAADPDFPQPSRAIVSMSYCDRSKQVVMVLADGSCAVCSTSEGGLSPLSELCFARWLCGPERRAVCAHVGARAQLVAVGCENGEVDLYRLHRTAMGSWSNLGSPAVPVDVMAEAPVRTLSLESWGHKVHQTGPVVQVEWSPDCRALAVGFGGQGVVVWSPSGCRLMCSLRQPPPSLSAAPSTALSLPRGLASHQPSLRAMMARASLDTAGSNPLSPGLSYASRGSPPMDRPVVPLDGSVTALCWGPMGYQLCVAEVGPGRGAAGLGGGSLAEVLFAHSLPHHHRVSYGGTGGGVASDEIHVLQAHDRLLLIREAGEAALGSMPWATEAGTEPAVGQMGDLTVAHVPLPHGYVASNWPVLRTAVSASGNDIAVCGRHGLAVFHRGAERWRLFGDVSQERQVCCRALGWLGSGVLVACSGPDPSGAAGGQGPAAGLVQGAGGAGGHELLLLPRYHLDLTSLLARHPLEQPPLAMDCLGQHVILASEPLEITVLEVAVLGELSPTGKPKATVTCVRQISMYDVGRHICDVALVPLLPTEAVAAAASPKQCVLLRWGGLLSVLDLEKGSEMPLATEVEAFWLSDALTCQAGVSTSGEEGGGYPERGSLCGLPGAADWQGGQDAAAAGGGGEAAALMDLGGLEAGAEGSWGGARPPNAVAAAGYAHGAAGASGTGRGPGGGISSSPDGPSRGPHTRTTALNPSGSGRGTEGAGAGAAGMERVAASGSGAAPSGATLDVEMPWWLYGPAGMQLCFPSSLGTPAMPYMSCKDGHDIELEFDQEVFPVGISLADDAIIGITQRIVRGPPGLMPPVGAGGAVTGAALAASASQLPCFHPIAESQPVLPCLLRRLLQRGAFQEAVSLARRHARGPHFARSLEWLLFTALELETNTSSLQRGPAKGKGPSNLGAPPRPRVSDGGDSRLGKGQTLLCAAADLVRYFPTLFAEVVVSVARKTDAALWPPLFDAVGSPSSLLEVLVEAGELASAACFLLIIDRLEGAASAQAQALRLMRASLRRGQYPLCCELLRFVVPPSSEHEGEGRASGAGEEGEERAEGPAGADGASEAAEDAGAADKGPSTGSATHSREASQAGAGPSAAPSAGHSRHASAGGAGPGAEDSAGGAGPEQSGAAPAPAGGAAADAGGRTWLGWLLGYGATSAAQAQGEEVASSAAQQTEAEPGQEQQPAQEQAQPQSSAPSAAPSVMGAPPSGRPSEAGTARNSVSLGGTAPESAASRVQHTLALLGDTTGNRLHPGSGINSPARHAAGSTGGAAPAPSSPAIAQMLMAAAASAGPSGAATADSACKLVAEHAWGLLEAGHLAALGQLAAASSFLPGGLAGMMDTHRDSAYARGGCGAHTPLELLTALALAVSELPVWSSEEVEACAVAVAALCRTVGAVAWAVALAVMLVDAATATAFREQQPDVWAQFVQLVHSDVSFAYLFDIVEVLSGGEEGGEEQLDVVRQLQLPPRPPVSGAPSGEGAVAAVAGGAGGLEASADVGMLEVRPVGQERLALLGLAGAGAGGQQGEALRSVTQPHVPSISEISVASPRD